MDNTKMLYKQYKKSNYYFLSISVNSILQTSLPISLCRFFISLSIKIVELGKQIKK